VLTRAVYLSAGWLVISLIVTLIGGTRLKYQHFLLSLGWLCGVLIIGDTWAFLTFGVPSEIILLTGISFLLSIIWILLLPDWNAFGQITWSMTLMSTVTFIIYAFSITAFSPLNFVSFLIASLFYFIETIALLLALSHAFESLDSTCRAVWQRRIYGFNPIPGYYPMVSLHLPTYNEPLDVVEQTLKTLARLDYPNFEVLVVDNNTPDEKNWRPLEDICRRLGPNFHCLHLDKWPGYKSGALNFALSQTDPAAQIITTIDADYQLDPGFLRELVPGFADPQVAFIQAPQDYRDYKGDTYTEATYYSYKYFFEVSMPARNEHNAIIFCGTMGLIRRSVLEEIGGWDEWCITEDAEASLRILKNGYRSWYINRSFGRGLMPFTFEGLKKQRFRWCFGGIQILKKHWEALMPWAHWVDPNNKLTLSQRYYYLLGGVQWFTDLFNLLFAVFLILGAIFSLVPTNLQIRPITSAIIILPALFLALNLWRFEWVLRKKLHLTFGMALKTMFNFFSMGWTVTLASIQGLIQKQGVFLRTPKTKSGSKAWHAIRVTQWETMIGLICVGSGLLAFAAHPQIRTLFLGGLLSWQGSLFLAAPVYSLLSARGDRLQQVKTVDRGIPMMEQYAALWALGMAAILMIAVMGYFLLPGPVHLPGYTRYQPPEVPPSRLLGLNQVPLDKRALPPTPTATATSTKPAATPTPVTPQPTIVKTNPAATSTPVILTLTPLPSQTPPPATATPNPTATPVILTPTQLSTQTQAPATATPNLTATPVVHTPTQLPTQTQAPASISVNTIVSPTPTAPALPSATQTSTP
jgi:cellulose synthase/poly-beta-1,6-N-acetylglucosamine synthase-like glycosyltransferase